jgi:tetratricopeptide (TPR) repeat protein
MTGQASQAGGSASRLRSALALIIHFLMGRVSKGPRPLAGLGRAQPCFLTGQRPVPLVLALLLAASPAAQALPFVPSDDALVLERVPSARDPSDQALRQANVALSQNRADVSLAGTVARLDIEQARRLGDPRFLGRAEAALAPWPLSPDTPVPVLLLRAVILQSNHDFAGSIAALQRVVAARPASAQAWLTLAAVHQAQAEYGAALHDCGQFASHALGLAPDACTASVMSLTGHAPLALRAITLSLAQNAAEAQASPSTGVWAATMAAETAERLGDPSAERRYREALAFDATDPYLLGAWSDWLLDQGRPQEVIALLQDRTRIDPLLLRLALAEQATGNARTPGHVADLAARFEASRLRGDTVHRREEARFALWLQHDPARALDLARANWNVQREPADARILLEAANAAGQVAAADPVRDWMRDNGVEDATLSALAAAGGHATPAAQPRPADHAETRAAHVIRAVSTPGALAGESGR